MENSEIGEAERKLWKKIKRNGSFRKQKRRMLLANASSCSKISEITDENEPEVDFSTEPAIQSNDHNNGESYNNNEDDANDSKENSDNNCHHDEESDDDDESIKTKVTDPSDLSNELRAWAINFQIKHTAINSLLTILKCHFTDNTLPKDARTLVKTPRATTVSHDERLGGAYWHYGLKRILSEAVTNIKNITTISLNVNIDGLPAYKSSTASFWPILVNINELKECVPPLVVGIFCGLCRYHWTTLLIIACESYIFLISYTNGMHLQL